jgi:hypothetical protein
MGIQSHVFAVALRTSTRHASFESVDDVIVFRLVPDTPERLPNALPHFFPEARASMARSTSSFFCTWCMVYM